MCVTGTVESDLHASPSPSPVHKSPTPINPTPPTVTNSTSPTAPNPASPATTSPVLSLTTNSPTHQSAASPASSVENSLLGGVRSEEESNITSALEPVSQSPEGSCLLLFNTYVHRHLTLPVIVGGTIYRFRKQGTCRYIMWVQHSRQNFEHLVHRKCGFMLIF